MKRKKLYQNSSFVWTSFFSASSTFFCVLNGGLKNNISENVMVSTWIRFKTDRMKEFRIENWASMTVNQYSYQRPQANRPRILSSVNHAPKHYLLRTRAKYWITFQLKKHFICLKVFDVRSKLKKIIIMILWSCEWMALDLFHFSRVTNFYFVAMVMWRC